MNDIQARDARSALEAIKTAWRDMGEAESDFHLVFTDLDDYPEADADSEFNHCLGYLRGMADGLRISTEKLLKELE